MCDHSQQESPLAVSSYCKSCKAYLSFEKNGEIKGRAESVADPFAHRPAQPPVEIDYKAREEKHPIPERAPNSATPPQPNPSSAESPESPNSPEPPIPAPEPSPPSPPLKKATPKPAPQPPKKAEPTPVPPPQEAPQQSPYKKETSEDDLPEIQALLGSPEGEDATEEFTPRYHRQDREEDGPDQRSPKKKAATERLVACFECGDAHLANARANSTQCRKCGRLISLKDQHIKEAWSSKIQTRGNVYIHRKGIVSGASIQCHNLVVEGDFTGNAECSGDLTLRRHGKIVGDVACDRLLVEKRAQVEFLNLVEMNECRIDGNVSGDLACRGRLALEKKATLTGNIKVGSLTVADGAKHRGQIQMGAF